MDHASPLVPCKSTTPYLAHLPLPPSTRPPESNIPLVSTTPITGSFQTYPNDVGWPQALPSPDRPTFAHSERFHPSPINLLEDFLQTWLFFGLLYELLGDIYREERYVDRLGPEVMVSTANLREDAQGWCDAVEHLSVEEGRNLYRHLQQCLTLANDALDVAMPVVRPDFNHVVRQSIALLCEGIAQLVDAVLPQPDECNIPMSWVVNYDDPQVALTMEQNNWCRSEVAMVRQKSNPACVNFMERMRKPSLGRDHTTCSEIQCQYLTTDDKTYRTRHVDTDHDPRCKDISIALGDLALALDQDALPLLRLDSREASTVNITVEPSGEDKAYVALSHVWADGLGNKKANDLPTCQLHRLSKMIKDLHGHPDWNTGQPEARDLLFWCDTLCVPVNDTDNPEQTRVRGLAMRRMRDVYQQSSYVLVLDRTLEAYRIDEIGYTEAAFRIMTSPWAHRLWTYQEAVLPDNLLFQFADKAIDIRAIWRYHQELGRDDKLARGIAVDIVEWCGWIKQPFHIRKPDQALSLDFVALCLHDRHVSYSADEPVCLATIFDLDVSRVEATEPGLRMGEFWRAMAGTATGIPDKLLFTAYPRLKTPGLRWAPSTFLQNSADNQAMYRGSTDTRVESGQLSEAGLIVRFPAVCIRRAGAAVDISSIEAQTALDASDFILLRDPGGWYHVTIDTIRDDVTREEVLRTMALETSEVIVLAQEKLNLGTNRYRQSIGLLTKAVNDGSEPPALQSLANFRTMPLPGNQQNIWTLAYELAAYLFNNGHLDAAQSQTKDTDQAPDEATATATATASTPSADLEESLTLLLVECASMVCGQHPSLRQLVQGMGHGQPERFLAHLAKRIIFGQYLTVLKKFEADHMWCVD